MVFYGQEGYNFFAAGAGGQGGGVDLEVPCFNLGGSLSHKGKADFPPLRVSPVSPHNEGYCCKTAGGGKFDGEEEVGRVIGLESVDG